MELRDLSGIDIADKIRKHSLISRPTSEKDETITGLIKICQKHIPCDIPAITKKIREMQHNLARDEDFCEEAGLIIAYEKENFLTIYAAIALCYMDQLRRGGYE